MIESVQQPTRARLYSIDNMRGIASFAVMFFHFVGDTDNNFLDGTLLEKIASYGGNGVEMFFIISGFIIPYTLYQSNYQLKFYTKFLIKRIVRLDPPYLATIAFIIILQWILSCLTPVPFDITWMQVLLHFGYLNTFFDYKWLSGVFWTLAIEFQYYLLISLLFPLLVGNMHIRIEDLHFLHFCY